MCSSIFQLFFIVLAWFLGPIFFEKLLRAFVDPSEGLDLNRSERMTYAPCLELQGRAQQLEIETFSSFPRVHMLSAANFRPSSSISY